MHTQGGAQGGADVRHREGILVGTQPDGRALPVSPRYQIERSTKLNGTTEALEKSGAFVVSAIRAGRSPRYLAFSSRQTFRGCLLGMR